MANTTGCRTALIVHAHHEPQSFSSALFEQARKTLAELNYQVEVSDLYAMAWNPVSGRANFSTALNPAFLKQQAEEQHASKEGGFAWQVESEMRKLEACDLLIFSFPLWWYGLPAILKGWVDRVFAMGRIYGGGKVYENGLGKARKRAMVLMSTGGGPASFSGYGTNLSLESVLKPIEHGIFWFNGFLPLDPFVAWNPARLPPQERQALLQQLDQRLRSLDREAPRKFPFRSDFSVDGIDQKRRFLVLVTQRKGLDSSFTASPSEMPRLVELKRAGVLLSSHWSVAQTSSWKAVLIFRESTLEHLKQHLAGLSLAPSCEFEVTELLR